MPVHVTCPNCSASQNVDEEKRGKKVRCRKCDELIPVPLKGKAAAREEEDDIEEVVPVKKKPAKTAAPDDDEIEVVEEAPVKKKPARASAPDDDEVEIVEEAPVKKKPAKTVRRDDDEDGIQEEAPKKKKAAEVPVSAKAKKRRDDDYEEDTEDEDKPRSKKGKKKERSQGATIAIAAVLILLIVGGAGSGIYFGLIKDDSGGTKPADSKGPSAQAPPLPQMPDGGPPMGGGRGQPGKPDPGKPDPGKPDPGKPDPGKPDPGKPDPGKPDPGKPDPVDPGPRTPVIASSSIYKYVLKSTAWIVTTVVGGQARGSGELIDRDNRLILTNYHVVHGMLDFFVMFPKYDDKTGQPIKERSWYLSHISDTNVIKGKVVAHDTHRDLALIQLDRLDPDVEPLPFAQAEPETGDDVHSVGNPGASDSMWVYTYGKVRSVHVFKWLSGGGDLLMNLEAKVVETDSPVNPGDSGGPCVNKFGELIGTTQGKSSKGAQISFFIHRSESEDFIAKAFASSPLLQGKTWVRAKRASLAASGGGHAEQLPFLLKKLRDPDQYVRFAGAQGLGLLGPDAHIALPNLVKALSDDNDDVRRAATAALRQVGQPTKDDVEYLVPILESNSRPEAKIYVLEALAVLGGEDKAASAAPNVVKLAQDTTDPRIRVAAMRAVGRMAAVIGDKEALGVLDKGLQDSDKRVRAAAAEMLTTAVPSVFNNVAKLQELLRHKEPEISAPAALAVARLGEKGKPAIPELKAGLREENRDHVLRRNCFVALKAVQADVQELTPELRSGINDGDVEVRRAALEAAGRAGSAAKSLVRPISDALADRDVRIAALAALKQLGPEAREAAGAIVNLVENDKLLRKEALVTLEALKEPPQSAANYASKLIAVFGDEKQKDVRDKLAQALAQMGKLAIPNLIEALKNASPDVRRGAAASLGAMGGEANYPAVTNALRVAYGAEPDGPVKDEEIAALKRVSSATPSKP
jgi:predicted Zn finger-like uncharacterized protein